MEDGAPAVLDGLDAVPQASLHHAYEAASDVPDLLGSLPSPDADERERDAQ